MRDDPAWRSSYRRDGKRVRVVVKVLKDGQWGNRPLAIPFPEQLREIRNVEYNGKPTPVVADDFALLPVMGQPRTAGQELVLTFGASRR